MTVQRLLVFLLLVSPTAALAPYTRRRILLEAPLAAWVASGTTASAVGEDLFENRNRQSNQKALIREDYWYMMGSTPPRQLSGPLKGNDPQWNAFGSCESSESGGNSCTYVSLKQRIPAYSKYGFSISYGAKEYQRLGVILEKLERDPSLEALWSDALYLVETEPNSLPPAPVDAELKMILLATALLTSPNFPLPSKQLLVARFYANETHQAHMVLRRAFVDRNLPLAREAWAFGRDSWNSYFQVVNDSISTKVGDKFVAIV